ncbi:AP-2 complex subunit alpha-1 [Coccomyxa sp. Obi]|nr:AP-2 complex subunit alpha-1 [Coccomyxa sp. Obi]
MAKLVNMRGLQVFIADIRNCQSKEQEKARVDKELGKIRKKFASGNAITEYDRKKYVWKLLYIFMLGYEVEFGHKQAADLIPATKYAEKQVGYMACAILLNEKDEFLRLIINSVRNDLISRNEAFQCLALSFAGNVGGQEMAALLTTDVMSLLTNGAARPIVRKKAATCLLRLIRKSPPEAELMPPELWSVKLATLLEERDLGVLLSLVTLLLGIVSRSYEGYESLIPRIVKLLVRLNPERERDSAGRAVPPDRASVPPEYAYYGIFSPWLQVKCLRVLQYFPPPEDPAVARALNDVLRRIITGSEVAKNVNKNNAQHAIVFEAIALALALEADPELLTAGVAMLGKFISVREPNIKYLGLENMVRLAEVPAVADTINRHRQSIINSLQDADISIRRRALDLLFAMCNPSNVREIVGELLTYLQGAEFGMREELVLKTAVLAERFYPDLHWYVDSMLKLIERAGELASKDIWHSTVQLITNYPALHEYAARKVLESLQDGASHDALVSCAGYILGEYGRLVPEVPTHVQFALLQERFPVVSTETKGLLLTTYLKFLIADPGDTNLKALAEDVFNKYSRYMDVELQQRAVEYLSLEKQPELARANVTAMPPWEKRKSLLLRRMAEREGDDVDEVAHQPAWLNEDGSAEDHAAANGGAAPAGPVHERAASNGAADFIGLEVTHNGADSAAAASAEAPYANGNGHAAPAQPAAPGAPAAAAAAPAAAPAPPRDPLEDLLSLSSVSQPEPPKPAPSAYDPFGVSGDPHALMGGPPPEIRPTGDIAAWYRKLCTAASGVLYEDTYLQVGMKSQFQGSQGQLMFFFGNKGDAALERLIFVVPPAGQFAFQQGAVPPMLEPKKQIQVPLMVACIAPFLAGPRAQIGYSIGGQTVSQNLALPAVAAKFCTPPEAPVAKEAFFQRWRAVEGPPLKIGERVSRITPVTRAPLEALLTSLNLGVQQGIDPDPDNLVAVATFSYTPPGGQPQQVPVMVRVEVEKVQRLQFQVTVASTDGNTTSSLKDLICQLLAKL